MSRGTLDSVRGVLQRLIPPLEHRPKHEIEAEVREEIEFHLALTAERIAEEERLDADSAKAEALKRFGDPESITRECTRIALKERIMLQRINTVLIALVAIGLLVVGIGTWQQQAQTTAAFEQINEKLTGMAATQPETPPAAVQPEPKQTIEQIYVDKNDGSSQYPVAYTSELTVINALRGTIGDQSPVPVEQLRVDIFPSAPQSDGSMVLRNVPATTDYELQPWDRVAITGTDAPLPWLLYSPSASDAVALEVLSTQMFEATADDADQISLQRIFEIAASMLNFRFVTYSQDIEEYEYTLDKTVARTFLESLTLEQAMDYACLYCDYINYHPLSWDIRDGKLLVGSVPFITSRAQVITTYRIDDLLGPFPSRDTSRRIRDILQHAAGFDYWRDHGGSVSMYSEVGGRLSITTIPRYHRTITAVLEALNDPRHQYPRTSLQEEAWFQTWLKVSNTTIGTGITADTPVVDAIQHAFERAGIAGFVALDDLESIGFEGDRRIGETPDPADSASWLLGEWLRRASPDNFDQAGWIAHGDGIVVASKRSLDRLQRVAIYDLTSLSDSVDRDFAELVADLIHSRINPGDWRDNGGDSGYIQVFENLLVIQTNNDNHRKVIELLNEYRAANTP